MTRDDVKKIIREEKLTNYSFFEDRGDAEDEIVIACREGKWCVYATDERASKITNSEKCYNSEENAIKNFVKRLKALNLLKNRFL